MRLLPCLSLDLCKSHFFSGDKPQFSFKFSKALVTRTSKGVKETVLFARGLESETGGSPFRSLLAPAECQAGRGPLQSLCALSSRLSGWAVGAASPRCTYGWRGWGAPGAGGAAGCGLWGDGAA